MWGTIGERVFITFCGGGLFEWEKSSEEALFVAQAEVLDVFAKILNIGRSFTVARNPHDEMLVVGILLDDVLQRVGHLIGEVRASLVELWHPAENLVELQEDARPALLVAEALLHVAAAEGSHVDLAGLVSAERALETVDGVVAHGSER